MPLEAVGSAPVRTPESPNNNFDRLPNDLIIKILTHLGAQDQVWASRVCRRFYHATQAAVIQKSIDFGKFVHSCKMERFYGNIDVTLSFCSQGLFKDLDSQMALIKLHTPLQAPSYQEYVERAEACITLGQAKTTRRNMLILEAIQEKKMVRYTEAEIASISAYFLSSGDIKTGCRLITKYIASPVHQLNAIRRFSIEQLPATAAIEHCNTLLVHVKQLADAHIENEAVQNGAQRCSDKLRKCLIAASLKQSDYERAASTINLLTSQETWLLELWCSAFIKADKLDFAESCLTKLKVKLAAHERLQLDLYWKKYHPSSMPTTFIESLDIDNKITHFKRMISADINADEALAQLVALVKSLAGGQQVTQLIWLGEVLAKKGIENPFEEAKAVARTLGPYAAATALSSIAKVERKYNSVAAHATFEEGLIDDLYPIDRALRLVDLGRFEEAVSVAETIAADPHDDSDCRRIRTFLRIIEAYAKQKGI